MSQISKDNRVAVLLDKLPAKEFKAAMRKGTGKVALRNVESREKLFSEIREKAGVTDAPSETAETSVVNGFLNDCGEILAGTTTVKKPDGTELDGATWYGEAYAKKALRDFSKNLAAAEKDKKIQTVKRGVEIVIPDTLKAGTKGRKSKSIMSMLAGFLAEDESESTAARGSRK